MAKIIMMAMSLRKGSLNKKLIKNAHRLIEAESVEHSFDLLAFEDFAMPVYDGDIESSAGIPKPVQELAQKIFEAQGLILSTPEYNGSIPGAFKNAIDWVSRVKPMPWKDKHVLLFGASPGALGAVRGLWHGRVPLEVTGAFVYPEMFGLPKADQAFDEAGILKDSVTETRIKALMQSFLKTFT